MFTPSNMLMEALNAEPRNSYDIIEALEGYLNADPKFQTNDFTDAINYVLKQGVGESELYQPFDSSIEFNNDPDTWDYDYYLLARVNLRYNFCPERITHVKEIAEKLYPETKSDQGSNNSQSKFGPEPTKEVEKKSVGIFVAIGAIIIALIVFLTKKH